MPITDQQFTEWLQDNSAIRCVLVEVKVKSGGVETTRYLSSKPFISKATDTPANTTYESIVRGSSVQVVERFDVPVNGSTGSLNYGDIEIDNTGGVRNSWLLDIWANRECVAYIGDVRWDRDDFRIIFSGVTEDIGSRVRNTLNLKLRDKLQRLNTPLTDAKLGGSTNNKDRLIPLCFGECHNVDPLLTNPATLEFQCNNGTIEDIIEVRDEGVPVSITKNLAAGKFTLAATPAGKITASVQGVKPSGVWINKVADIIQHIVTNYGEVNKRFTLSDIDTSNFSSFNTANPQPVGVYANERENVLGLCNAIANSIGARLVMSRNGKLRLHKLQAPTSSVTDIITENDVVSNTFHITGLTEVQAAQRIGYCKNWTIQTKLETGIPLAHKDLYEKEWLVATAQNSTTKTDYKLDEEPRQIDTYLLTESDANAEANRLLELYRVPRTFFRFEGSPRLLELEIGDQVEVQHPMLDYRGSPNYAVIIGLSANWQNGRVLVEGLL